MVTTAINIFDEFLTCYAFGVVAWRGFNPVVARRDDTHTRTGGQAEYRQASKNSVMGAEVQELEEPAGFNSLFLKSVESKGNQRKI